LLYLELLKFVKVINQKFATYVLCLVQIALDIRPCMHALTTAPCFFTGTSCASCRSL